MQVYFLSFIRDSLRKQVERLAPRGRFELPTFRLTAERSTIELPGNVFILRKFMGRFKLWFSVRGVFLNCGSKVWCFLRPSLVCPGQLFDSSTRVGAITYNAVHTCVGPLVLAGHSLGSNR